MYSTVCTTIRGWEYSLGTHIWIFMAWVLQAFFPPCPPSLWLAGGIGTLQEACCSPFLAEVSQGFKVALHCGY